MKKRRRRRSNSIVSRRKALALIGSGITLGAVYQTNAFDRTDANRLTSISSSSDEDALLAFTEKEPFGIPNNEFQTVASIATNLSGNTEIQYTISTDQDGVSIRFDGETTDPGGTRTGSITIDETSQESIDLECSTPGQVDETGVLTVDIPTATADSVTIADATFSVTFSCGDPPQATVDLEDIIEETQTSFGVEYSFEDTDDAFLVIENETTTEESVDTVFSDGTRTVDAADVGGLTEDDFITATLWDTDERVLELAADSTTVISDGPVPATIDVVAEAAIGNNNTIDYEFEVENEEAPDTAIEVFLDDQAGGGGAGTAGRGWADKRVTIDETSFEPTSEAADNIGVNLEAVDLFDSGTYEAADQSALDDLRSDITTDSESIELNDGGDEPLDVSTVPI